MKKNLLKLFANFLLLSVLATSLNANNNTPKNTRGFTYDHEKGWWWYEDPAENNETRKKIKVSPLEKKKIEQAEDTKELLKQIALSLAEQNKINKKILERLEYAYPNNTPKYGVNSKGEKCLANSSADCFIMPVIAEGQHVPVLKKFLRNPSPENSKEWLKWQGKYFGHISKVSHGLRFAFLNGGSDVYKTETNYVYGDNLFFSKSEASQGVREAKIISKYRKQLGYLIFLGQNSIYEQITNVYKQFANYDSSFLKDMEIAFVFPTENAKKQFEEKILPDLEKQGYKKIVSFFKKQKMVVKPALYKQYNVKMTPTVVLFFSDKTGKKTKKMYQVISVGNASAYRLRRGTINFLTYNGIISEEEMGADKNWNIYEQNAPDEIKKLPDLKKATDFNATEATLKKLESEDK